MSIPYLPLSLIKKLVLNQRFNFHPTQTLDPSPRFQASLDEIAMLRFSLIFKLIFHMIWAITSLISIQMTNSSSAIRAKGESNDPGCAYLEAF